MKLTIFSKKQIKKKEPPKQKWSPENNVGELAIDAYETDNELIILSPVAGITPKDLEISMEEDMLIIKGKRAKPETTEKNKEYFYKECFWGRFEKKLILPEEVDIAKIKASIKSGILTLKIPKKRKTKKKEIRIEIERG